mgnify:FL=1|tara:strand:+ start:958 stop:1509 length:552 start_codon:yes stop_codon:yes gene_type:complete
MRNIIATLIVLIIGSIILLIPEYIENIIGDYIGGSYLIILAFIIIVIPISILFESLFSKFMNLLWQSESYKKELIKYLEKSKNKSKTNNFGIKCYNCNKRSLKLSKDSIELSVFARKCSECESMNIIRQPTYCGVPPVLSILFQKAGFFTSIEQFNLSFMFALILSLVLLIIYFLTPAKPLHD